jgi:hypothetical protein
MAVRTLRERAALEAFDGRSLAVGLSGYLFFGSAVLLTERVRGRAPGPRERSPGKPQGSC